MFIPEEVSKKIGKNTYLIKALPALYGLNIMNKLRLMGDAPSSEFVKEVIFKSVTCNNIQPTDEWFNRTFSRNYQELYELFQSIVEFNFGDKVEGEDEKKEDGTLD